MSVRRLAPAEIQPASFAFTPENERWLEGQIAKYPEGRQASAVIPALWQAQKQNDGWLPKPAIEAVAATLGMPIIRVMEVATFYTMFNLEPVGRFFVQLCGTVPCHVKGALDLKQALLEKVGDQSHVTPDGNFSWLEVECLGACCNAPMVQINDDYYEDLTPDLLITLLDDLAAGREVKVGPQNGRHSSEPEGEVKTLKDEALFDGSLVGAWRKRFEEQPAKAPEDGAATATGPNDPRPAKPDAGRAEHKPVADAPAQRAQDGKASAETPSVAAKPQAAGPGEAETTALATEPGAAKPEDPPPPPLASGHSSGSEPSAPIDDGAKPELLTSAKDGKAADLQQIWGVGPKLEALLNRLGVYHLAQIANWTDDNLRWVDQHLDSFKGRGARERWIDQAKVLAGGGTKGEAEAVGRGEKGTA